MDSVAFHCTICGLLTVLLCTFSLTVATTLKFDGTQYVRVTLPEESHTEVEDISLRFRTKRSTGLLLTTMAWGSDDQLQLRLVTGRVQMVIQLGNTSKVCRNVL